MPNTEHWRPIDQPTTIPYEVSDMGRVRSLDCLRRDGQRHRGVILRTDKGGGYPRVKLSTVNGQHSYMVHRLVAEAWVPNPDPKTRDQVNHINGDITDSRAANLEWVTGAENVAHAVATKGRRPSQYVTPAPKPTAPPTFGAQLRNRIADVLALVADAVRA